MLGTVGSWDKGVGQLRFELVQIIDIVPDNELLIHTFLLNYISDEVEEVFKGFNPLRL